MKIDTVQTDYFDNESILRGSPENTHYKNMLKDLEGKTGKILEIGCSDGKLLSYLEDKGFEVKGLDISEKQIEIAKNKGFNVIAFNMNNYFESEEKYDYIIAGEVIEHLTDPISFLNNCYDLLKENGILYFTTPNLLSLENRILMFLGLNPRYAYAYFHYHMFTIKELKRIVKESKFNKIDSISGNFVIVSMNRNKFIGFFSEYWGEIQPSFAKHFCIKLRKEIENE